MKLDIFRTAYRAAAVRERYFDGLLLFVFMLLVSGTAVNYSPYVLRWDELYHAHRTICMSQAVYGLGVPSLSAMVGCLAGAHKAPIMELVNLPWGAAGGTEWGIGLLFVGIALFVWALIVCTFWVCTRAGVSRPALLLAGIGICLSPSLRGAGGALLADMLLAWSVGLAVTLVPLELRDPQAGFRPSLLRGLLWGFVIDIGMLSKVTFAVFVAVIGPPLLWIRWRRSGLRPLLYTLGALLVASAPAFLIWAAYGRQFVRHAVISAWDLAPLWGVPGEGPLAFTGRYFAEMGAALIPLLILAGMFLHSFIFEKQERLERLVPVAAVLLYLAAAATSQNRDPRFGMPVTIALPLALVAGGKTRPRTLAPGLAATALLAGILSAIPMVGRAEITPVRETGALLSKLSQGAPATILIATDGPEYNIETFQLACQIGGSRLRAVRLDTLVYDAVNGRTLEDGLRRIDRADYVLFLKAGIAGGPDWSRKWAGEYRAYAQKVGAPLDAGLSTAFEIVQVRAAH